MESVAPDWFRNLSSQKGAFGFCRGLEVIVQKRWKSTVLERKRVVLAAFLTTLSYLHQKAGVGGGGLEGESPSLRPSRLL